LAKVSISETDRPVIDEAHSGAWAIREFLKVGPVGMAITKQDVHHGTGECAIGAGLQAQRHVRLLHRAILINVDSNDLCATLFTRLHGMRHHVDLRVDRVCAPDDNEVRFSHFARIWTSEQSRASDVPGPGECGADRRILVRIPLRVAQAVDAVTHDQPHGAGEVVGPDSLRPVLLFGFQHRLGRDIEGVVPRYPFKLL
jgi:hypothetical protein